ncbi:MAG: hypothetical protein KDD38_00685 [Bdellovibrionales bacterium]|nr:hypothetical protein [Bdellovibrionales bacterium]
MKGLKSKLNRRGFLSLTAKTAALTLATPDLAQALGAVSAKPTGALSILQCATTNTTAQFTVDIQKDIKIKIQAVDELGQIHAPVKHSSTIREYSKYRVDKAIFTNLSLNRIYKLQIINDLGEMLDHRVFRTLDLEMNNPRIAFLSCMRVTASSIDEMWQGIPANSPDMLVFLGDNVYGNHSGKAGPDVLWERYFETRARIPFYHFYELTPVIATWDDHDFGDNNAEGDYPHKEDSLETFRAFYGQDEGYSEHLISGPGNAMIFSAFHQHFALFDGRTNRSTKQKIMFGQNQLEWFYNHRPQDERPIWLIMGSQFFGAYTKKESYEGCAKEEFNQFLAELKKWPNPVCFVAGDKHYSEIMDIEPEILGYSSFELTSSSMHSLTRPYSRSNPRRRSIHRHKNFMLLDIQNTKSGFEAQLKVIGKAAKIEHKDSVFVRR